MLEIFRRNRFFNSLLLLPYVILVRVWLVFDDGEPAFRIKGILTEWVFGALNPGSGFAVFLSIFIVYLQALMLNRLVIRNRLSPELTLFPGLFYTLLVSFFPEYNSLSSPLIANTFAIIAMGFLMGTNKTSGNTSRIFTAGFWFSIAFLFYWGYIVLFLVGIVGLGLLRTVKGKEWLQFTIGFMAPLWVVALMNFLIFSDLAAIATHFTNYFGFFDIDIPTGLPMYLQLGFFGTLIVISILNIGRFSLRQNILVQKKLSLLYGLLFLTFGILFVQHGINYEEWTTLAIPLACFLAVMFIRSSQLLILEIIHFAMLLAVLGMQIYVLL